MTDTPLALALEGLAAAPDDPAARMRVYARLADSELVLLLEREAEATSIAPRVFDLEAGRFALVFDSDARLAGFCGAAAPYAAMPGRALVAMLAGQGVGLSVNPGDDATQLLPAEAVDWLADTLDHAPRPVRARPETLGPPTDAPAALLSSLDAALARSAGLARSAYLAGVGHDDTGAGLLLAFVDTPEPAQPALARAVNEALTFSGLSDTALDVAFVTADDAVVPRLVRVALRFEIPEPEVPDAPAAPGHDPERPPRLR